MTERKKHWGLARNAPLPYTACEMVRFQLFDIPISIHPSLWVVLALLGGGLHLQSAEQLLPIAIFVISAFLSLLVHELGHALTGRALGGGNPQIHFAYLGGLCHNPNGRWSRLSGAAMTVAGPLAAIGWGVLAALLLSRYIGDFELGLRYAWHSVWFWDSLSLGEEAALRSLALSDGALYFFQCTLLVSFWWSILNLLPVYPLDGGQILGGLMTSAKRLHMLSMAAAALLTALAFAFQYWFPGAIMIYFAVFNYKAMLASPH